MKKINLLFSTLMIALAILVACGAAAAPAIQMQALSLNTASNGNHKLSGKYLFDSIGRYQVREADLQVALERGDVYQFFGFDWHVVNIEGNVATFWMTDPYTKYAFNTPAEAANLVMDNGSNVCANGYKNSNWLSSGPLGESDISAFLRSEAKRLITKSKYKYKNKVKPGFQENINEKSSPVVMQELAYCKDSLDDVYIDHEKNLNSITADYNLGDDEVWWLPSIEELATWNVHENIIKWTYNTTSKRAWLRTPELEKLVSSLGRKTASCYAIAVCSADEAKGQPGENGFVSHRIDDALGVRPAIHLDITNIETEYQDHINNPVKEGNGWDNWDDWMKALFIVICVLGLAGIGMVIIAVIVKSRQNKAE